MYRRQLSYCQFDFRCVSAKFSYRPPSIYFVSVSGDTHRYQLAPVNCENKRTQTSQFLVFGCVIILDKIVENNLLSCPLLRVCHGFDLPHQDDALPRPSENHYLNGKTLRMGSRGSKLALTQTENVRDLILNIYPQIKIEIQVIKTKGDKILDVALSKIGDKGLFTKELEVALMEDTIDLAVHSLKDMPTRMPPGLSLGAISIRHTSNDCLILHEKHAGKTLDQLPEGSVVGSSSLRRVAQLKRKFPSLVFKDIRGNLNTRLQKLDNGDYDGIILAVAGISRLGLEKRISQVIDEEVCHHAVGQGALGVQIRELDSHLRALLLNTIHHRPTQFSCEAERSFLRETEGGCQVPVGVTSYYDQDRTHLRLRGIVLSVDGSEAVEGEVTGSVKNSAEAIAIGKRLADDIKSRGGQEILQKVFATLSRNQQVA
ncbi:hydroxymethylbilane synthase [Planoprotostelium fungivorum]|uniref:hydroxymethylbilane synthase n=1 Tax=Planoprotostelium fungivorum TaxID=1890364 RepID=A0A2P6MTH8_9EUKA|nr:hydroxymethylbilane synthase [Planoprotostelium fungivorum]